jgi:hypothetical protein
MSDGAQNQAEVRLASSSVHRTFILPSQTLVSPTALHLNNFDFLPQREPGETSLA